MLRLAPLVRRFRERVEADEIPLEDSMRTLSYASELVLFKVRWLLPGAEDSASEEAEEEMLLEPSLEAATASFVMEPSEVETAFAFILGAMKDASARFSRGFALSFRDERRVVVSSIDPAEIRKALLSAEARSGGASGRIVLPRWSFVTHLRDFWREVSGLASKGAVLRFSRFLGQSKMDAILNFLAFLELIKRKRLYARQRSLFGEIVFSTDKERVLREEGDSQ